MATKKRKRITFEKSSGNVFADIGFANPEREQLKAHLTLQIYRIIKSRGLTQVEAGAILGIKQPHVSALMRNRSGNFSVERLVDFLIALTPSNPKAPWYFEIDHENMILSPKLPEVPPR